MSSALRQRLNELASSFASNVLDAIRTASLDELLAESGGRRGALRAMADGEVARRRSGRLPRRSSDDIGQVIDSIVGLLKQNPKGLRAEDIRQKLGLEAKELPRPLKEAVEAGRLGKSGQKRATTYFLKGGGGAVASAKAASAAPAPAAGARKAARPARGRGGRRAGARAKKK